MSALNSLVSGADCGPSNALSSVVKHVEVDRSLQRVRTFPRPVVYDIKEVVLQDKVGGPSQRNVS